MTRQENETRQETGNDTRRDKARQDKKLREDKKETARDRNTKKRVNGMSNAWPMAAVAAPKVDCLHQSRLTARSTAWEKIDNRPYVACKQVTRDT